MFDPGKIHYVMTYLNSRTGTLKLYDHGSIILQDLDLRSNIFKGGGDDATIVELKFNMEEEGLSEWMQLRGCNSLNVVSRGCITVDAAPVDKPEWMQP